MNEIVYDDSVHGTIGPLCEYFYSTDAPACEHISCLNICDETDPIYPNEFIGGEWHDYRQD